MPSCGWSVELQLYVLSLCAVCHHEGGLFAERPVVAKLSYDEDSVTKFVCVYECLTLRLIFKNSGWAMLN